MTGQRPSLAIPGKGLVFRLLTFPRSSFPADSVAYMDLEIGSAGDTVQNQSAALSSSGPLSQQTEADMASPEVELCVSNVESTP